MEIEKLGGTTERLYRLVAPLVMKPCILRENNNYPFKTSMHHIWFIAIEEERVVGFMPVEIKDKYAVINNYYIDKDDPDLLAALLREVIRHYAGQYKLQSVTHSRLICVCSEWLFYNQAMEIICKNGTPTTRNPLNVYEQAQIRLEKIFGHFDNIYVSFSGGKDSGVLLQLCTDYIRKHCPGRKRCFSFRL